MKPVSQLSRRFRVAFDDTKTVPNAGLVIPLRLADRLGVNQALQATVTGRDRTGHPNSGDKAMALVATLIAGGEFISDVGVLGAGATLSRLGYQGFSESRLGEWLRSLTNNDIAGFAHTLTTVTGAAWATGLGPDLDATSPTDPLIIDIDSTHTETYGTTKQGAESRNYLGKRGYHPLLAVESSTGHVIAAQLRNGTTSSAHGAAAFVADTLQRVRDLTGSLTPLLLRADSGFYLRDLVDRCVAADTRFSITVRQYRPIRHLIAAIDEPDWQQVSRTATTQIDIAEVPYEIKGTSAKPRPGITCRLIVRRVRALADTGQTQPRLFDLVDYHAFVTNQTGDPETLWHRHTHRAVIETVIRDLKHGLALNHYPSASFTANAAWLHLNTLAHNLCRFTNRLITPHTLTTKTLRYRYLTIPGRITTGSRTTTLHLPTHWPWHHHITHALTNLNHPTAA